MKACEKGTVERELYLLVCNELISGTRSGARARFEGAPGMLVCGAVGWGKNALAFRQFFYFLQKWRVNSTKLKSTVTVDVTYQDHFGVRITANSVLRGLRQIALSDRRLHFPASMHHSHLTRLALAITAGMVSFVILQTFFTSVPPSIQVCLHLQHVNYRPQHRISYAMLGPDIVSRTRGKFCHPINVSS